MNEPELREALLQQRAILTVEAELKLLRGLLETEQRRTWKLAKWTLITWIGWPVCVLLSFLLVRLFAMAPRSPGELPATPNAILNAIVQISVCIVVVGVVILPVAGVVLLIMFVSSRRSTASQFAIADRVTVLANHAQADENR